MCAGSDTGLGTNGMWTYKGITAASCTGAKCEYYTPPVTYSCQNPTPPLGANWCSGYNNGLISNLSWTRIASASACTWPIGSCQYFYTCSGLIPGGSTMCPGDDTNLSSAGTWSYTGGTDPSSCTAPKCQYYTPTCSNNCSAENSHCIGTTYTGTCGTSCDGKKDCRNENWQEVSPN